MSRMADGLRNGREGAGQTTKLVAALPTLLGGAEQIAIRLYEILARHGSAEIWSVVPIGSDVARRASVWLVDESNRPLGTHPAYD